MNKMTEYRDLYEFNNTVRFCVREYLDEYIIWIIGLIALFVIIAGSACSFWLGLLVGLAVPYYIIPKYFSKEC